MKKLFGILLFIFLIAVNYAQDHLNTDQFGNKYDQILHIGDGDVLSSGLHIVERSIQGTTNIDSSALAISDSVAGTRSLGMGLLIQGDTTYVTAADLDLLLGLSSYSVLYDSSGIIVNAPRTIYGWSHDLVFSATDYNTIEWTSGQLFFSNTDTFDIVSGNTGNITDITYIYFDEDVSSTVLQTTTAAGAAVGSGRVIVCVGEDVTSPKDAVYQVFGGEGGGVLILADNIVANSITGNEIATNTITTSEILFGSLDGDSLITQLNSAGTTLFITADVINAISSSASGQRIVISPVTNRLTFYNGTELVLTIGEDILGDADGIALQDSGIVYKISSEDIATSTFHSELYSQTTKHLSGMSSLVSKSTDAGTPALGTSDIMSAFKGLGYGAVLSGDIIAGGYFIGTETDAGLGYGVYANGSDYGIYGDGDKYGVYGNVASLNLATYGIYGSSATSAIAGTANSYGVYGSATGSAAGTNNNFGIYGSAASSGDTNYGIYGTAISATTNWAGYFKDGDVKIENHLNVGDDLLFHYLSKLWFHTDVNLYRNVANSLKTDDRFVCADLTVGTHTIDDDTGNLELTSGTDDDMNFITQGTGAFYFAGSDVNVAGDVNATTGFKYNGTSGITGTYTFGGGGTGDIATMTFNGGILTAVTTVP